MYSYKPAHAPLPHDHLPLSLVLPINPPSLAVSPLAVSSSQSTLSSTWPSASPSPVPYTPTTADVQCSSNTYRGEDSTSTHCRRQISQCSCSLFLALSLSGYRAAPHSQFRSVRVPGTNVSRLKLLKLLCGAKFIGHDFSWEPSSSPSCCSSGMRFCG